MKCRNELHTKKNGVTNLSLARTLGSSQRITDELFDHYQSLLDPIYIWNIDKHESEDMCKVKRVVAIKGINQ